MDLFDIQRTLLFLPGIIIGLTVHEYSHALVAKLCGDTTTTDQGRVTLNPLKHIDTFGFIMLLVAGFGWAKPVQFNEQNLRNPKTDVIKIALAGPLSNAIIAIILSILFSVYMNFSPGYHSSGMQLVIESFYSAIFINWGLFILNLIPLPPLDGFHVFFHHLKIFPSFYNGLFKYGSFLLFGLIIATLVTKINFLPIGPAIQFFRDGFLSIIGYR